MRQSEGTKSGGQEVTDLKKISRHDQSHTILKFFFWCSMYKSNVFLVGADDLEFLAVFVGKEDIKERKRERELLEKWADLR